MLSIGTPVAERRGTLAKASSICRGSDEASVSVERRFAYRGS
jgi:hypothetical protein